MNLLSDEETVFKNIGSSSSCTSIAKNSGPYNSFSYTNILRNPSPVNSSVLSSKSRILNQVQSSPSNSMLQKSTPIQCSSNTMGLIVGQSQPHFSRRVRIKENGALVFNNLATSLVMQLVTSETRYRMD